MQRLIPLMAGLIASGQNQNRYGEFFRRDWADCIIQKLSNIGEFPGRAGIPIENLVAAL